MLLITDKIFSVIINNSSFSENKPDRFKGEYKTYEESAWKVHKTRGGKNLDYSETGELRNVDNANLSTPRTIIITATRDQNWSSIWCTQLTRERHGA